jgi:hypothetical protein
MPIPASGHVFMLSKSSTEGVERIRSRKINPATIDVATWSFRPWNYGDDLVSVVDKTVGMLPHQILICRRG